MLIACLRSRTFSGDLFFKFSPPIILSHARAWLKTQEEQFPVDVFWFEMVNKQTKPDVQN